MQGHKRLPKPAAPTARPTYPRPRAGQGPALQDRSPVLQIHQQIAHHSLGKRKAVHRSPSWDRKVSSLEIRVEVNPAHSSLSHLMGQSVL